MYPRQALGNWSGCRGDHSPQLFGPSSRIGGLGDKFQILRPRSERALRQATPAPPVKRMSGGLSIPMCAGPRLAMKRNRWLRFLTVAGSTLGKCRWCMESFPPKTEWKPWHQLRRDNVGPHEPQPGPGEHHHQIIIKSVGSDPGKQFTPRHQCSLRCSRGGLQGSQRRGITRGASGNPTRCRL